MLNIASQNFTEAANKLTLYIDNNVSFNLQAYEYLNQHIDIYLRKNYNRIIFHIKNADIDETIKKALNVFMVNDSLMRFPDKKNIRAWGMHFQDVTYPHKRSAIGYKYIESTKDTTYHSFIKNHIIKEQKFKKFAWGLGIGGGFILHNKINKTIFTNPSFLTTKFDFYFKNWYVIFGNNIGSSINKTTFQLDTFKLEPKTKFSNIYIQLGLGYRFYLFKRTHFVPYCAFNNLSVSYSHQITEQKAISKSSQMDAICSIGFAVNHYFSENKLLNIKPSNHLPWGVSFKWGVISDKITITDNKIAYFFSLEFCFLMAVPENHIKGMNYYSYY